MGCAASTSAGIDCNNPSSSSPNHLPRRALSLPTPLVHHPPSHKGDTHHLVSLTSSTYGSLRLIHPESPKSKDRGSFSSSSSSSPPYLQQETVENPSVINTWELMAGLEDFSPKFLRSFTSHPDSNRNIFDDDSSEKENRRIAKPTSPFLENSSGSEKPMSSSLESSSGLAKPMSQFQENSSGFGKPGSESPSKPLWEHLSEESRLAGLNPSLFSSFRRTTSLRPQQNSKNPLSSPSLLRTKTQNSRVSPFDNQITLPGTEDKIVVYFTSLRGIRRTYEDCCIVRNIFAGFRVSVDERDISMDSAFRKELQNVLSQKTVSLPQVFIRGMYIGGAEEIKQLHETGELGKILRGFPIKEPGIVCESCGDARFVPCMNCNGSRKVFDEEEGQLRRCPECNENGLIRCPYCCC